MFIVILPACLAIVLAVAWVVSEWKSQRGVRIALGLAVAVATYFASLEMSRFGAYLKDRQMRSCLMAMQQSLDGSRGDEVIRALRQFEAASSAGESRARDALCDDLQRVAEHARAEAR